MKHFLGTTWENLRASYWFVPSLMALAASVLAFALVYIDGRIGANWTEGFSWIYANKPDGARTFLSTIAGSMITVAGVTFSITIASVAYATSLFGPRLLTNFMRDRGNQVTLGTFIATFLYCLLVLRTIRAADEPVQGGNAPDVVSAFVPHLAMLVALLLAVASVAVLIYFIHHVPEQIHAGRVIGQIGRDLADGLEKLFPETTGTARETHEKAAERLRDEALPVASQKSGYVQYVDADRLVEIAQEIDGVVFVETGPGDFAHASLPVAKVWSRRVLSDKVEKAIRSAFTLAPIRSPGQDIRFLADELSEIAARALSPGVNDPYTAMNCLEWLTSAAVLLAQRPLPSAYRADDSGRLRVVAATIDFALLLHRAFDSLRPYVGADRNAVLHLFNQFNRIAFAITRAEDGRALAALAARYATEARRHLHVPEDVQMLDARHDALVRALRLREAVPV